MRAKAESNGNLVGRHMTDDALVGARLEVTEAMGRMSMANLKASLGEPASVGWCSP